MLSCSDFGWFYLRIENVWSADLFLIWKSFCLSSLSGIGVCMRQMLSWWDLLLLGFHLLVLSWSLLEACWVDQHKNAVWRRFAWQHQQLLLAAWSMAISCLCVSHCHSVSREAFCESSLSLFLLRKLLSVNSFARYWLPSTFVPCCVLLPVLAVLLISAMTDIEACSMNA